MPNMPCTGRALASLLALLSLAILTPGTLAGAECTKYKPSSCLFSPEAQAAAGRAKCGQSGAPCTFTVAKNVPCLFPETGKFTSTLSRNLKCSNGFMSTSSLPPKACGARCCAADYSSGRFEASGSWATGSKKYSYVPKTAQNCKYDEMTRSQVMTHLRNLQAPIVVFGDSLMRQVFLRLVAMMRGQERIIDPKIFTHAQYLACDQADALRISRNSPVAPFSKRNDTYLEQVMPAFFSMKEGPGIAAAKASLAACTSTPIEAHYVSGPTFVKQTSAVKSYVNALPSLNLPAGARPVYVVGVDYWDKGGVVDPLYLDAVYALKYTGAASKVFMVGIPSFQERNAAIRANYQRRNQQMRAWAAAQGEPFHYVDFDAISSAPAPRPAGPSSGDKHFGCLVWWDKNASIKVDGSLSGTDANGRPVPQIQGGGVQRIHVNGDGKCADEYNRALWTAMFNVMIGAEDSSPPLSPPPPPPPPSPFREATVYWQESPPPPPSPWYAPAPVLRSPLLRSPPPLTSPNASPPSPPDVYESPSPSPSPSTSPDLSPPSPDTYSSPTLEPTVVVPPSPPTPVDVTAVPSPSPPPPSPPPPSPPPPKNPGQGQGLL